MLYYATVYLYVLFCLINYFQVSSSSSNIFHLSWQWVNHRITHKTSPFQNKIKQTQQGVDYMHIHQNVLCWKQDHQSPTLVRSSSMKLILMKCKNAHSQYDACCRLAGDRCTGIVCCGTLSVYLSAPRDGLLLWILTKQAIHFTVHVSA